MKNFKQESQMEVLPKNVSKRFVFQELAPKTEFPKMDDFDPISVLFTIQ